MCTSAIDRNGTPTACHGEQWKQWSFNMSYTVSYAIAKQVIRFPESTLVLLLASLSLYRVQLQAESLPAEFLFPRLHDWAKDAQSLCLPGISLSDIRQTRRLRHSFTTIDNAYISAISADSPNDWIPNSKFKVLYNWCFSVILINTLIHTPMVIGCHARHQPVYLEQLGFRYLDQGCLNTPRSGLNWHPSYCQATALTISVIITP